MGIDTHKGKHRVRISRKSQARPCSKAKRVAAVRVLRKSLSATWELVSPSATSPSTSTSRGVSPAGYSGVEEEVDGCSSVEEEAEDCSGAASVVVEGSSSDRAYPMASSSPVAPPAANASAHAASPKRERTLARYGSSTALSWGTSR